MTTVNNCNIKINLIYSLRGNSFENITNVGPEKSFVGMGVSGSGRNNMWPKATNFLWWNVGKVCYIS